MKYPSFLKENSTIGVTAPSDGIIELAKLNRLNNAYRNLKEKNFFIKETDSVRKSEKGRSNDAKKRAQEFMNLIEDETVDAIICAAGGDFLLEILPFVDFSKIENHIKWIQGYSDPTGILFPITTKLDIATIYANNVCAFGMEPWHSSLVENIQILKGENVVQHSFDLFEGEKTVEKTGLESYSLTQKVVWKNLFSKEVEIKGRMIGGCLDLLAELVGTPYDFVESFLERHKEDGIIWFFDNCEKSNEDLVRIFWKLEICGWFRYCKGILLGRSMMNRSFYDISLRETLIDSLKHLEVPVIYDADLGHVAPRLTIINGGYATIHSKNGNGCITFEYK